MIPVEDTPTVAAFDFDGTLSKRDNLIPFLRRGAGTGRTNGALVAALPNMLVGDRDGAKATLVRHCLEGRAHAELVALGDAFAQRVLATHMRADVVERAAWHGDRGHARVIVSASLACFLEPVAERLDFDAVLATELEVGADGRCTGRLEGANVRGREKARRVDAWVAERFDGAPVDLWAYGNSGGDAAMLAAADHPVRVGRARLRTPPGTV
jgi:phosphatidylglycerophosphatase C